MGPQLDALSKLCGYVLTLVVALLLVAGLAALVVKLWRMAVA
jgi:hypothetical protein